MMNPEEAAASVMGRQRLKQCKFHSKPQSSETAERPQSMWSANTLATEEQKRHSLPIFTATESRDMCQQEDIRTITDSSKSDIHQEEKSLKKEGESEYLRTKNRINPVEWSKFLRISSDEQVEKVLKSKIMPDLFNGMEKFKNSTENSETSLAQDVPMAGDHVGSWRETNQYSTEIILTMTSSPSADRGGIMAADCRDDTIMNHQDTSPQLSILNSTDITLTPSDPFKHDSLKETDQPLNETLKSCHTNLLQLPDIIFSHGTFEKSADEKPTEIFHSSDQSNNFISFCLSTNCEDCRSRSVFIFPELIADVGGCLCSRNQLQIQQSTTMPDLLTSVPDLIISLSLHSSQDLERFEMTLGKTILVTGGAGYIGSHCVIELIEAGFDIVVVDNLVNASMESIRRVEKIVGKQIASYSVDLLDKPALDGIFKKHTIYAVIHLAGLKAVGESCEVPLLYYKTNVGGTTNLLEVMEAHGVFNFVFSSSATVYGTPQFLPLTESHPVGGCTNPYGKTKFTIEQMLNDLSVSNKKWNIIILRYFNPVGAHKSGTIGEDPSGVPNNLMPFIGQVAVGRRPVLKVYGSDYDTHDGTGVRDYIHVVDLARGHVAAVSKLEEQCGLKVYNLGTGQGYSVLDMVKAFEKASGKKIPYELASRRPGDVASCYSDPTLASNELHWKAEFGLDKMCEDLWRWQSQNPHGYNAENIQAK